MAWTAPRTWTTAELVTAALLNAHLRDNLLYLYSTIGVLAITAINHTNTPYAATTEKILLANTSGGNVQVNLPAAAGNSGRIMYIKNVGTGLLTIDGNGAETVEGEATQVLLNGDCALIVCDGSNWVLI